MNFTSSRPCWAKGSADLWLCPCAPPCFTGVPLKDRRRKAGRETAISKSDSRNLGSASDRHDRPGVWQTPARPSDAQSPRGGRMAAASGDTPVATKTTSVLRLLASWWSTTGDSVVA